MIRFIFLFTFYFTMVSAFAQTSYTAQPITGDSESVWSYTWIDMNDDGLDDILYVIGDTIFSKLNTGNKTFAERELLWISPTNENIYQFVPYSEKLTDSIDVIVSQGAYLIRYTLLNGQVENTDFSKYDTINFDNNNNLISAGSLNLIDMTIDDSDDLVFAGSMQIGIFVGINNYRKLIEEGADKMIVADIDNDQKLDIVTVANNVDRSIFWYKNIDTNDYIELGDFEKNTIAATSADYIHQLVVADLNGDNYNDIVVRAEAAKKVLWYENNQDGTFSGPVLIQDEFGFKDIACIDMDNDEDLDLLWAADASNFDGKIAYKANDGDGNFGTSYEAFYSGLGASDQIEYIGSLTIDNSDFSVLLNNKITLFQYNPNVTFTVVDEETEIAIEGATVDFTGYGTQVTDADGKALFETVTPAIDIPYTVTAENYVDFTGGLVTVMSEDVAVQVSMTTIPITTYDVTFNVTDGTDPIENATVELDGYGEQITNASGIVKFTEVLPEDNIPFTVSATDYMPYEDNVSVVDSDETVEVTLVSVSVDQITNELIQIYPNPASTAIIIQNLTDEDGTIEIYSLDGKLLLIQNIYHKFEKINISELNAQVCILKYYNQNTISSKKLIIK